MKKNSLRLVGLGVMGVLLVLQSFNLITIAIGGDVPENLALHGTASVSSVHEGDQYYDATKLNDGLYGPDYSWIGGLSDYVDPATQKQYSHRDSWWAQIDLGAVKKVSAVALSAETPGRTPKDFTIQVSKDGVNYSIWKDVTGWTEPARLVYSGESVSARYVKIVITDINGRRDGGFSPGIQEIEIYENIPKVETTGGTEQPKVSPPQSAPTATTVAFDTTEQPKDSSPKFPAVITIAASNSSPKDKARADYVCDGIDDHVELQKAIDSLSETDKVVEGDRWNWRSVGSGGGTVQLSPGAFYIGAKLRCYDKVVNLIGDGRLSTSLKFQKGVNDDMILVGLGKYWDVPAGRIAHMTLNGNSEFQTKGSGIRMQSNQMIVIEDMYIHDFKEDGIHLDSPGKGVPGVGTIENCRIDFNKKNGIYFGPGAEGWLIRGNFIGDNGTMGQPYHGIFIQAIHGGGPGPKGSCNAHVITGNMIWQNSCTQISIDGGAHIMITGNMILSSPYELIKIYGGGHLITITGNALHSANETFRRAKGKEAEAVPYITLGESPTSTAKQVVISSNAISVPGPAHGQAQSGQPYPQPPAVLIEKEGSDYNKFIGNVIQGYVTTVTLVGEHSSKDSSEDIGKTK